MGGEWLEGLRRLSAAGPPAPEAAGADYPSLGAQAASALAAAARFVASGLALASEDERSRRLEICRACEHFAAQERRCRKCGCLARWKGRIAAEHCPLDPPRW